MQLFSKSKQLFGLDIGSSSVKVVELRKGKRGYELLHAGIEPLASDTVVDGAIMDALSVSASIRKLLALTKIKTRQVATSVAGHSVIVKKISLPLMSPEELEESIQWEAEQHIPFDIADVNLDYQILNAGASSNNTEVLLVAVKKDKILNHTSVISQAGCATQLVDIDSFALQNAYEANYNPAHNSTVALLNIGAATMNIVVTRGGMPVFTRDVSAGGNQITDVLQKELGLSFEEAEDVKKGVPGRGNADPETVSTLVQSVSEVLLLEVQKTFDFYKATSGGEQIQRIYVSGGCANLADLLNMLEQKFGQEVEMLDPFASVTLGKGLRQEYIDKIAPSMAVAVGLALRSFDE